MAVGLDATEVSMLIPLSWLSKYVSITVTPRELAHRLTMAGTEISAVDEIGAAWDRDKVLIGQVLKVEPHPNADRLTLPTVDLGGGETATVVCGAPNVAAGQKIAFAREGARLYSPRAGKVEPLKAAKIRGVLSAGMVCSVMELGLGDDHTGILVLDDDAPTGAPLIDHLGDAVLDADVTPNRPDCLSMLGIAHEVGAITGEAVTEPDLTYADKGDPIAERVSVEIADPDLCPRYTAGLVTGVTVGPSPRWLRDALARAGLHTISNIVDATNYVMLEYGQPMHAFDFDKLKDHKVVVRRARPGEKLATLDDETHELRPPMLVIADSTDPIALAGVVGGVDSSVTDKTTSILLESASFNAANTHRTTRALGGGTEASYRFERGIRAELAPRALARAIGLILEIAGGEAAKGTVDLYPGREPSPVVKITANRIRQSLGIEPGIDEVERVLASLGFRRGEGGTQGEDELLLEAPYWRSDIGIEDDVVEEVARITGYDDIPTTMISTPIPHHEPRPMRELRERVRDVLAASGMQEVITYSLTDRETLEGVGARSDGEEPLPITNPMSSHLRVLRTSLRGSMLRTLAANRRVSQGEGMRLFEIGRVYLPREEGRERELPEERETIVGVLTGLRSQASWLETGADMDFFDAKGVLEALFEHIDADVAYEPSGDPIWHPGKMARLVSKGKAVGVIGEIHPSVVERFELEGHAVAMFEIDLASLYEAVKDVTTVFAGASRFPESERDLALVVDSDVPSARIQAIIRRHKLVKGASPVDLYTGEGVPSGKKSIAYKIVFQSDRSTLTAELVDRAQGDILRQLQRELGAELRA
jgi:phenylalanyl-tRNA synthetase beta chain